MGATKPVKGQPNPWAPSPPPAGYIIANSFMRDMFIRDPKLDVIDGFSFNNPADVKRLTEGYDWADLSPRHTEKLKAFKAKGGQRSVEHTSELHSLMSRSSAVFCLEKQIKEDH